MPLSRREIHTRATRFAKQWADAHNEEADAKPFWVEFFNVFAFRRYEDASLRAHSMSTTCPAQRDAHMSIWARPVPPQRDAITYSLTNNL